MENQFKKNDLIEMSIKDLIKKKKNTSFAAGILIAVLIVLFGITLFKTINKGFTPLLLIPFGLLPILIMMFDQIKAINKELKK
ncbi:hypothetical protein [Hymenobacter sp. YC55]|uniref:hypothetical protein n=1 Tax=Hymenobacter sp. YC55 TaxID=3034019 RepID=UPI0023F7D5A8|nr:hypothetical protein [Hymenobacter sp. YC55]MDF7815318.1 hypothetical protein [Hymenobacter sp. YC55]